MTKQGIHVGVIQFVFHFLQLVPIRFAQHNLCCTSNPNDPNEASPKIGLKSNLPRFSYDYWKCMFVDSLTKYIVPPNYIHC